VPYIKLLVLSPPEQTDPPRRASGDPWFHESVHGSILIELLREYIILSAIRPCLVN
jgi:hypothetical protein